MHNRNSIDMIRRKISHIEKDDTVIINGEYFRVLNKKLLYVLGSNGWRLLTCLRFSNGKVVEIKCHINDYFQIVRRADLRDG